VSKSGSWFSLGDEQLGQGREKSLSYLEENPAMVDTLLHALKGDKETKPEPKKPKTQAA
jgi:recombination protein RecA